MKLASIYARDGALIVCGVSQTVDGVWVANDHCVALPGDCSDLVLATSIRAALLSSAQEIPHPSDFKTILAPLRTLRSSFCSTSLWDCCQTGPRFTRQKSMMSPTR